MLRWTVWIFLLPWLAACGDAPPPATTSAAPPAPLENRDTPIPLGAQAPAFAGCPEGKAFVIFYRGHW